MTTDIEPAQAYDALAQIPDDLVNQMETWTVEEVQRRYQWVAKKLVDLQNERRQVALTIPGLGKAYNLARAKARMTALATNPNIRVGDLDDIGTVASADERFAWEMAKELKASLNISIEVFSLVNDILRSVNKDARQATWGNR